MASEWFYTISKDKHGPTSAAAIAQLIKEGAIKPSEDLAWKAGMSDWKVISSIPELVHEDAHEENPYAVSAGSMAPATPQASGELCEVEPGTVQVPLSVIAEGNKLMTPRVGVIIGAGLISLIVSTVIDQAGQFLGPQPDQAALEQQFQTAAEDGDFSAIISTYASVFTPITLVFSVISGLFTALISAGFTVAALRQIKGKDWDFSTIFTQFRAVLPVFLATIIYYILVLVGTLLLIVPGIWISVRLWPYIPAMIEEDLGPINGLKRAFHLSQKNGLSIFGVAFLTVLILLLSALMLMIGLIYTLPLVHFISATLYYHLRYGESRLSLPGFRV